MIGPTFSLVSLHIRGGGAPFDSEGGGLQIWSGQIIYFQHEIGRKIYIQVYHSYSATKKIVVLLT